MLRLISSFLCGVINLFRAMGTCPSQFGLGVVTQLKLINANCAGRLQQVRLEYYLCIINAGKARYVAGTAYDMILQFETKEKGTKRI